MTENGQSIYLNLIGYDYPKDIRDEKFIDNLIKFKLIVRNH